MRASIGSGTRPIPCSKIFASLMPNFLFLGPHCEIPCNQLREFDPYYSITLEYRKPSWRIFAKKSTDFRVLAIEQGTRALFEPRRVLLTSFQRKTRAGALAGPALEFPRTTNLLLPGLESPLPIVLTRPSDRSTPQVHCIERPPAAQSRRLLN